MYRPLELLRIGEEDITWAGLMQTLEHKQHLLLSASEPQRPQLATQERLCYQSVLLSQWHCCLLVKSLRWLPQVPLHVSQTQCTQLLASH